MDEVLKFWKELITLEHSPDNFHAEYQDLFDDPEEEIDIEEDRFSREDAIEEVETALKGTEEEKIEFLKQLINWLADFQY